MKRAHESEGDDDNQNSRNKNNQEGGCRRVHHKRRKHGHDEQDDEPSQNKQFVCSNCKTWAIPPVLKCPKNHILCKLCFDRFRVSDCLKCDHHQLMGTSRSLNKKIKKICLQGPHIKCPFWKSGCQFQNQAMVEIIQHKELCSFRDVVCDKKQGSTPCCGEHIQLKMYGNHLKQNHGQNIYSIETGENYGVKITAPSEYDCTNGGNLTSVRLTFKPSTVTKLLKVNGRLIILKVERTLPTLAKIAIVEQDGRRFNDLLIDISVGVDENDALGQAKKSLKVFGFNDQLEFGEQYLLYNVPTESDGKFFVSFKINDFS